MAGDGISQEENLLTFTAGMVSRTFQTVMAEEAIAETEVSNEPIVPKGTIVHFRPLAQRPPDVDSPRSMQHDEVDPKRIEAGMADQFVSKELFEERSKRLEEKLDAQAKVADERFKAMDQKFDHLEKHIDSKIENAVQQVTQAITSAVTPVSNRLIAVETDMKWVKRLQWVVLGAILVSAGKVIFFPGH